MVKIIETNTTLQEDNTLIDFQSIVIEIDSWNDFVDEIKKRKSVSRMASIGSLHGVTLPSEVEVLDEKCDHQHLSVTFRNPMGIKMMKLAYLINE